MPIDPAGTLRAPVGHFVAELAPELARLSPPGSGQAGPGGGGGEQDVALEAFNLAASFVDADGRHTDDELAELMVAFAPWLGHLVGATPAQLRRNELVTGKRSWKDRPSAMFEVLVAADRVSGGRAAWRYYELAMLIAHTVCSLDEFPAREELADLDRYRQVLLDAMRAGGVDPRPGPLAPAGPAAATPAAPAAETAPAPVAAPVEELLAELDGLIGLDGVKEEVRLVTSLLRVQRMRRDRGLPVVEGSRHLVFTGNPGTGKTTVARLLARIYHSLGVVSRGHLVETDRSGLVAGYIGQTAIKVKEVVTSALGGVLLIDEAYALARGREGDFGQEAVDTLVKLIEDHREEVVVIAAGYTEEMATFIDSNPGLRSRFPKTIHFPDYSDDELVAIFERMCEGSHYRLTDAAGRKVKAFFAAQARDKGFGNGRLARNTFEAAIARQATRLVKMEQPTDDDLGTLRPADIPAPTA